MYLFEFLVFFMFLYRFQSKIITVLADKAYALLSCEKNNWSNIKLNKSHWSLRYFSWQKSSNRAQTETADFLMISPQHQHRARTEQVFKKSVSYWTESYCLSWPSFKFFVILPRVEAVGVRSGMTDRGAQWMVVVKGVSSLTTLPQHFPVFSTSLPLLLTAA